MPTIRSRLDRRAEICPSGLQRVMRTALVALAAATVLLAAAPGGAVAAATNGRIAFASDRTGDLEIYSMNPDGTGQAQLTNSPGDDSFPSWSKNGAYIAFQSMRTGIGCPGIFLMNGDGTGQAQVTSGHCDQEPTWDPTSTQIAFTRDLGTDVEIFRVNAHVNGTGLVQLTNTPGSFNVDPAWGQNNKIVFTSNRDGNEEIYSMNADGTGQTRLTNNSAPDYGPYWSPDGSKIVFQSERDGNSEIYVMNADGTGQTRLTNNTAVDSSPAWSPDGSQIAFHSNRTGNFEIFAMNTDGTSQRQLTSNTALDKFPDWQPLNTNTATQQLAALFQSVISTFRLPPGAVAALSRAFNTFLTNFDPSDPDDRDFVCTRLSTFIQIVRVFPPAIVPTATRDLWVAQAEQIGALIGCSA
jgi:Tol biopolymer transport system component